MDRDGFEASLIKQTCELAVESGPVRPGGKDEFLVTLASEKDGWFFRQPMSSRKHGAKFERW